MSTNVISTPELLEQVLVQLPMRDLLVAAPLVSKSWHALTLSPTVRRALFFEPDPLGSASERVLNPLLMETFPPFFALQQGEGSPGTIETMPWSKAPYAFKRKEASWRRMLVTQPPVHSMIIRQTYQSMSGAFERRAVLEDLSLRMGALYDLTVLLIDRPLKHFFFRWCHGDTKLESDLMLTFSQSHNCTDVWGRKLGERFHSDGEQPMEIPFGEWGKDLSDYDSEAFSVYH
ncbi:hypothetical protein C8R45DRAFT_1089836 [Mycena sanguinolenta]|nr:hypothetical protein C8R45DRAFT_1089836 [Mycena sanguinolenta]